MQIVSGTTPRKPRFGLPGRFALVLMGLTLGAGLVELLVRCFPPKLPTQVVPRKLKHSTLRSVNGIPVWEDPARFNSACATDPARIKVLFLGDSITFGSGVSTDQTFEVLAQKHLNEGSSGPAFCVMNYAQGANGFEQDAAIGAEMIPSLRPDLVLWGMWNETRHYVLVGGSAYNIGPLPGSPGSFSLNDDGYPVTRATAFLPAALNRWLFEYSLFYSVETLRAARIPGDPPRAELVHTVESVVSQVISLAESTGSKLIIFYPPVFDRVIPQSGKGPPWRMRVSPDSDWQAAVAALAARHRVRVIRLADSLAGRDPASLILDDGIHFSAEGHREVAPIFERLILDELGTASAPAERNLPPHTQTGG
jgi:lysophospholipase L1-like esterase